MESKYDQPVKAFDNYSAKNELEELMASVKAAIKETGEINYGHKLWLREAFNKGDFHALFILASSLNQDDDEQYLFKLIRILYEAKELLQFNPLQEDVKGKTALDYILKSRKHKILQYLLQNIEIELNLLAYQKFNDESINCNVTDLQQHHGEDELGQKMIALLTAYQKYKKLLPCNPEVSPTNTAYDHPDNIQIYVSSLNKFHKIINSASNLLSKEELKNLDQELLEQLCEQFKVLFKRLQIVIQLGSGNCGEQAALFAIFLKNHPDLPEIIKQQIHLIGLAKPDDHNFLEIGAGSNSLIIDPWFTFKPLDYIPLSKDNLHFFKNNDLKNKDLLTRRKHGVILYKDEFKNFLQENEDDKYIIRSGEHVFKKSKIMLNPDEEATLYKLMLQKLEYTEAHEPVHEEDEGKEVVMRKVWS